MQTRKKQHTDKTKDNNKEKENAQGRKDGKKEERKTIFWQLDREIQSGNTHFFP